MEKLNSIYAQIDKLNDRELSTLGIYLATSFDRRTILLKGIFDVLIRIVYKDHHQIFALLFHKTQNLFARIVCPYISIKDIVSLSSPNSDFKVVINLRDLLKANLNESVDSLRLLRNWLTRNIENLRQDSKIHAKIYVSDNGAYITSANFTKNGKRLNREAGVFSDTEWFRDNTMPIFCKWWEEGDDLTVEMIDEAFSKINQLNESPRCHDVNMILSEMDASEYENACNLIGREGSTSHGNVDNGPNFRDTSPKSFFTYYFIALFNKLNIRGSFSNIIDTYFSICKWQQGDVDIPSDLASDYIHLADAINKQRHLLCEGHSSSEGNAEPVTLLIDHNVDVDSQIAFWKEQPLAFIELFNKELFYRAYRFVKKARALDLMEKVYTHENMELIQCIRKKIEVTLPRPFQRGVVADVMLIPLAHDIVEYQIEFLGRLYVEVSQRGSCLFHNTLSGHNKFLVDYYFPEDHEHPMTSLVVRHQGRIEPCPLSKDEALHICQLFSKEAVSNEALLARGYLLFQGHLQSHFEAIGEVEREIIADLFAAFMGIDSYETLEYLSSTSVV